MKRTFNIQQLDDYPDNYDWLGIKYQNIVLGYMNGMQALANRYYREYNDNIEEHIESGAYIRQYNHTITGLTGAKNAYATLGIRVEYNWPNNPGMWILATKAMAEAYNNAEQEPTDEVIINPNTLLDYSDVGH